MDALEEPDATPEPVPWFDSCRGIHRTTSSGFIDRYAITIKHVPASGVGDLPVIRLRPHHIEDLYTELLRNGHTGSSIRKLHWALRQALAWAHRRGPVLPLVTTESLARTRRLGVTI